MNLRALAAILAGGYPVLVIAGVYAGSSVLKLAGLALLLLAVLLPGLARGSAVAWTCAIVITAGLAAAAGTNAQQLLLLATPVAIPAMVAWAFGRTLAAGRTPLIERFVRLLHPPDDQVDPRVFTYARRLTWGWTLLLTGLALANAVLGTLMSPGGLFELLGLRSPLPVSNAAWALCTNALGYVIVGVFAIVEYTYRVHRFPNQPYRSFPEFLRRSLAVAPQLAAHAAEPQRTTEPAGVTRIRVPRTHPALPGHFPGRPVVPGVVILDHVIAAAQGRMRQPIRVLGLEHAKFSRPLLPEEEATVDIEVRASVLRFTVAAEAGTIARGSFKLAVGPTT